MQERKDKNSIQITKDVELKDNNSSRTSICLTSPIIWFPKQNCDYHFAGTKISFREDVTENIIFFDISSGIYEIEGQRGLSYKAIAKYQCLFVFHKSIFIENSAICMFFNNEFFTVSEISFTNNNCDLSFNSISIPYFFGNQFVQKKIQKLTPEIPITSGRYPIFLKDLIPYNFLYYLYNKFIKYNHEEKLNYQYKNSENKCHIRAHFMALLLEKYGLQTFKIFKHWDRQSWKSFTEHSEWEFHCALMLKDENDCFWVRDPWVGNHKKLLTIPEWLRANDEPVPSHARITNSLILDHTMPETPFINFRSVARSNEWNIIQMLASSALPNLPEMPIAYLYIKTLAFHMMERTILSKHTKTCRSSEKEKSKPIKYAFFTNKSLLDSSLKITPTSLIKQLRANP